MTKVAAGSLCVFGLIASSAPAGVVSFTPTIGVVDLGERAVFQVAVSTTDLTTFDRVRLLLGADILGLPMTFEYSSVFNTTLPPLTPAPFGLFASDLLVGGSRSVPETDPTAWHAPLVIGTLTIQTSGVAPGSFFHVFVDGIYEAQILGSPLSQVGTGLESEHLQGSARVSIPEPSTLSLLGLGVLGLIRSRFATK